MRNPSPPAFRQTPGPAVPTANSVFDNFNTSISNSTHAVYGLVARVHTLADQARGPSPASGDVSRDTAPSTESMLQGLERAILSLQEAVGRLDNQG